MVPPARRSPQNPPSQRVELTFKPNATQGRHGWLRLTPAYSVRLVQQILGEFGAEARQVWDPFSGTGTTSLCAAYAGLSAQASDINPFLVWFGRVKSGQYSAEHLSLLRSAEEEISGQLGAHRKAPRSPGQKELPPLKNIERWWNPAELLFVNRLRQEICRVPRGPLRDLLDVAFCRTLISLSNAAFNHQSMSFKDNAVADSRNPRDQASQFGAQWAQDVTAIAATLLDNPAGSVQVKLTDSRTVTPSSPAPSSIDLLITSPPYPNRMSYIRELRPYMYWLDYLGDAKEAGALDWQAVGGTWGSATSRLLTWEPTDAYVPRGLPRLMTLIRRGHPKNGELMARYVQKYFDDMFHHFETAARLVRPGGTAHYIVGNSSFYGNLVPAERFFRAQLQASGFPKITVRTLRKRNSKKELFEFHIIAQR